MFILLGIWYCKLKNRWRDERNVSGKLNQISLNRKLLGCSSWNNRLAENFQKAVIFAAHSWRWQYLLLLEVNLLLYASSKLHADGCQKFLNFFYVLPEFSDQTFFFSWTAPISISIDITGKQGYSSSSPFPSYYRTIRFRMSKSPSTIVVSRREERSPVGSKYLR